ncbi:hypothetical protein Peur_038157 [Populus x canadensis]
MNCFKEKTGHALTKAQLKNKWDGIKKGLENMKKIDFQNEVGWSNELGIISAIDEWRKNASNKDTHLEESSGDSEEDTLPNFVKDVNNMVAGVNFANSSSNPSSNSEKRKGVQQCTQKSGKKRVIKEFHSIEEVVSGSELYSFATEFLMVRSRREMWAAIGDKERKFQWLKLMFERRLNVKP